MNEKTRKKKFLEHYFAICVEHGYCIDWSLDVIGPIYEYEIHSKIMDTPQYSNSTNYWRDYKEELMESLSD